jgi:ABC-type nickel/cobalt efflux system permease component RcnA/ABC-type uncharacterized transport system substrate-binding protein
MFRIILLLSAWVTLSWGCLACSYGDIKILTHLTLNISKNTLNSVDVEWTLDPMFSQMVLGDYDTNRNGRFDSKEVYEVYQSILAMKEVGFFIRPHLNKKPIRLNELKNFTVTYTKGLVIYRFRIPLGAPLVKPVKLQFRYDADAAYNNAIVFHLNEKNVSLNPKGAALIQTRLTQIKNPRTNEQILDITVRPRVVALVSAMGGATTEESGGFSQTLRTVTEKIHSALIEAQEHPSIHTIGAILLFSLLYGILHAAGPGHGKTLVASYFSTNERSYRRGVSVALFIAATHVVSAFVLTMILYWFVHTMFSQTISDISLYATKASGAVILLIALYLARQKWLFYRPKSHIMNFTATEPHMSSCGCHSCKTTADSTDLMLILGAGIVPCPGTIVVFLFAISMGMIWLGALSAVIMSLGMGLTIAITAALGTALRRKSNSYGEKVLKIIDIFGITIILLAGIFLMLAG